MRYFILSLVAFVIITGGYITLSGRVVTVTLSDQTLNAVVADEPSEREIGLGRTESLANDEAMLFVFDRPERHSIWMKDVKYPIDVIWLNQRKEVIYTVESMQPDSYPKSYAPNLPALYVLEMSSGFIDTYNINEGMRLEFSL